MRSSRPFDKSRLQHRWFDRVADLVARLPTDDWPSIAALNDCYAPELASVGVRLIESEKTKPTVVDGVIDAASLYEVRIAEHGEIPTRPRNIHDLLNTLVWAAFPKSKLALSRELAQLQRARISGPNLPNARTPAHDRLALIDEGALLIVGETRWIFGHAIYEHAYDGNTAIRGAAVELVAEPTRESIDRVLAASPFTVRSGAGIPID